jgi:LacI family transcriptional regulator
VNVFFLSNIAMPSSPLIVRKRATLSDVAALAGVDVSTVSRVLCGDQTQRVRQDTRERIETAARTLGYQPNMNARSLRTARTYTLGIGVPQLDNPVFSQIILGAERGARERGYSLLIAYIEENAGNDNAYERLAQINRVDGLLVTTLDDNSVMLRAVKQARVPFILLNRKVKGVRNCIYFDSRRAARMAVEHLIELGHTRIAHLSGQLNPSTGIGRFAGYCDALEQAGLPLDPDLVAVSGYTVAGGAQAMRAILEREMPRPTAVFPLTLAAAAGAMMALHAAGIRVPEDMSVITVHDGPMAEVIFPQLSTVRMPVELMGYQGALSLIDLIEGRLQAAEQQMAPLGLLLRQSTSAPCG